MNDRPATGDRSVRQRLVRLPETLSCRCELVGAGRAAGNRTIGGASGCGDGGVATVAAAVLSLAVLAVLVIALQLGSAVVTRHRAEGAADLAALAAAGRLHDGSTDPCARADRVVRNMHATLRTCRIEGRDVRVEVRASPSGFDFLFVDARARAGPARR